MNRFFAVGELGSESQRYHDWFMTHFTMRHATASVPRTNDSSQPYILISNIILSIK